MPLSVKDGMGAWVDDFKKSDAPQFKGKSEKERREMAIAAYMSAKKGDSKDEGYVSHAQRKAVWASRADGGKGHPDKKNEEVTYTVEHKINGKKYIVNENQLDRMLKVGYQIIEKNELPFDPDPKQPSRKNSDGSTTKPMSRAKQLAQLAMRNRKKNNKVEENYNWKVSHGGKDVHVKAPHAGAAVKKAQKGFGNMDLTKAKVSNLGKVGAPTRAANKMESAELEEMYASTTEPHKDGHRSKVVRTQPNGKTTMSYLGQHVYKSKEHARNAADHIANGMRKGRASDSYIQDFARRHHKEHGMKESVEHLEEAHAYAKAAKALHDYGTKNGGIDKKDFHAAAKHLDNVGKSGLMQKGTHLAKFNNHIKGLDTDVRDRIHMTLKQHGVMESVQEAAYGTQAQRMMSPLQKIRQDKEKADRDRDGKLKSTALPMRKKKEEVEEAGSPERYKMIKKAGDKYNKEKKKAERDAMKAMSKDKDMMGESDVSELKKSTLGSYVNKASKDAASKAYSAASAAKDNNTEKGGKDFSKSMKRLRGINTATKKLAKEDTNEAKSFDQKFKDHLKFATSKSPAVQNYLAKRKADRDAMNKKNDPNAAKKGYALTAVPPERKYQKLQKAKKTGKA